MNFFHFSRVPCIHDVDAQEERERWPCPMYIVHCTHVVHIRRTRTRAWSEKKKILQICKHSFDVALASHYVCMKIETASAKSTWIIIKVWTRLKRGDSHCVWSAMNHELIKLLVANTHFYASLPKIWAAKYADYIFASAFAHTILLSMTANYVVYRASGVESSDVRTL